MSYFNGYDNGNENNSNNGYNTGSNNEYNTGNYNPNGQQPKKGFAVASLVLGICSLVFCCCNGDLLGGLIPLGCSIVGLVLGILAKSSGCGGMAIAGIVTSSIGLALAAILWLITIIFADEIAKWAEEYQKMLSDMMQSQDGIVKPLSFIKKLFK